MTKQTIEVEGLPEGYRCVSVTLDAGERSYHDHNHIKNTATVMLEKIQMGRIVLEEIPMNQAKIGDYIRYPGCSTFMPVGSQGYDEGYEFFRRKV